jgi:hypothetical protein
LESASATRLRTDKGATPTFWSTPSTTPSSWPRRAASKWSGVTSGWFWARASATAVWTASWVRKVQRFGSNAIAMKFYSSEVSEVSPAQMEQRRSYYK